MARHSSVLAWRIPGMGEPGGLPSLGSHRVGHDWSDLAAAAAAAGHWASLVAQLVNNLPAMQEILVQFLGQEDPGEGIGYPLQYSWASLVVQMVKNLPAMWETWLWSLDWEDPLQESMATHSSILAWRIPMGRGAWRVIVHGVTKSWTWLSD